MQDVLCHYCAIVYNDKTYFADTVFHLDDSQKELADNYAKNLSLFLGDGMFQGIFSDEAMNGIPSLGNVQFTDGATTGGYAVKIGLIRVDSHHYPNLALMKLAAWHKFQGDSVEWWWSNLVHYDLVYMSKIFSDTYTKDMAEPINADRVIKGGTGYAIALKNN